MRTRIASARVHRWTRPRDPNTGFLVGDQRWCVSADSLLLCGLGATSCVGFSQAQRRFYFNASRSLHSAKPTPSPKTPQPKSKQLADSQSQSIEAPNSDNFHAIRPSDVPLLLYQSGDEYMIYNLETTQSQDSKGGSAAAAGVAGVGGGGGGSSGQEDGLSGRARELRSAMLRPTLTKPESWTEKIKNIGMPAGYPHSVRPGYRTFFHMALLNGMINSFASQISTQSLLSGFFKDSSAGSWMLKDLAPTLLSAAIANYITSYGTKAKLWFVVGAVMSQLANVLEFLIPYVLKPDYYIFAAISTSLLKGSAGLMFGIVRANFLQHYALSHNLGEVTKKIVSIGMVVWTVCGAAGLAFATYVKNPYIQFGIVLAGAVICVILPYLAVKPVAFRALTPITTDILLWEYFNSQFQKIPTNVDVAKELGIRGVPNSQRRRSLFLGLTISPKVGDVEIDSRQWKRNTAMIADSMLLCGDVEEGRWETAHCATGKEDHIGAVNGSGAPRGTNIESTSPLTRDPTLKPPFVIGAWLVHRRGSTAAKERLVLWFDREAQLLDVIHALFISAACLAHASGRALPGIPQSADSSDTSSAGSPEESKEKKTTTLAAAIELELQPQRVAFWRLKAQHFVSLLDGAGWDDREHSIDVRGRRISFTPDASPR